MDEKTIFKIAIVSVIVGLAILLIFAGEVDLKKVEEIDSTSSGEIVKISGTITKLTQKDKTVFAEIEAEKTEKTSVIIFPENEIFLQEGDYVEVDGTVEEYLGKKEVLGNKVTVKSKK